MQNYSPHTQTPQSTDAQSPLSEPIPDLSNLELSPNAHKTLWLAAIVAAICGGLYGYDTGIVSGALLLITRDFHLSSFYQEMVASAILAGAVMGSFITGWMSERFGRRNSVMIVTAVFVLGAMACALAPDVYALIAARVFLGLAVGGSTQVVPMYISELAPAKKRGHMVTMFNIAIGVGIFTANVIGFAARDAWGWRPMVAIAAIPALVVFISMFFLPKSPRWAAENESLDSAIEQLRRIRTTRREIRKEIKRIQITANEDADPDDIGWRGLMQPWVRPALVAALGVAFFTQAGVLEMMIYYAPTFLSDAGFGNSAALLASIGISIVYLVMTVLGSNIVDRIGRRRLVLVMGPGSVLSLIGLGIMFLVHPDKGSIGSWMIIIFMLLFMVFNAGGIQVVGWLLGAEMFPLSMRGNATSLHSAMLWGSDLLVTSTALTLVSTITLGGTMWFYAGVNLASVLFIYFFVPETRGASLEDIEDALREGRFRPTRECAAIVEEEED
ncbi:sugar porter family MFS transporter [Novacetimonas pomaceti]|uniref:sugar porter family MFS transporter n=1 Tax=Novacetimonas pomaceti TaxID=2021998 RepID=UPI001C2DECDB|nr:sugar porter family MFS transporter [Novacetimonas pomaceti]MBV1835312.1 sugar porter family MFS transporter [Novacetimonas pomaceti]